MAEQTEPQERVYRSKKSIIFHNFIGGIAWAFGTTVGFAIVFIIVGYILSKVDLVPIIGGFIQDVLKDVLQRQPLLVQ